MLNISAPFWSWPSKIAKICKLLDSQGAAWQQSTKAAVSLQNMIKAQALSMLQYGESVDVADWFSSFCAIHDSSDGTPEDKQQAAPTPKPKKRRGRPSKKVLQRVSAHLCLALSV